MIHKWEIWFEAEVDCDTVIEVYSEALELIGDRDLVIDKDIYIHIPRGCGVWQISKDGEVVL